MKNLKFNLLFVFCLCLILSEAQFTQGNMVVLQAGDGLTPLANTGNAMLLREYNTNGIPTFSLAIPSSSTNAMLIRGSSVSEGYISLSADNKFIVFGGYMKSLPNTSTLNALAASTINRGIGLLDANGNFSIGATCSVSALASGDIRGATASNSANVWATSSSQGCSYYGTSSTAANIQNSKSNLRAIHIFNNQLYFSSQVTSGTPAEVGVFSVGNGTPNTASQTISTVINTGTSSLPGQFYFNANNTICYVADARSLSNGGGIQKWINVSGVWSLAYTLSTGSGNAGAFGVIANFSGINPIVYATTTEGSNNRLIAINDIGSSSTCTTLATASGPNVIFRGLCFSPNASNCTLPSISNINVNGTTCANHSITLTAQALGTAPFTYSWSGPAQFASPNASLTGLVNQTSGIYTLMIANTCGTAAAIKSITVYPGPIPNISNITICNGGTANLIASPANTYSWSNGTIGNSITVTPSVSTIYSLIATTTNSCSGLFTVMVNINNAPSLTVSSQSICVGQNATVMASGASSYTWSNGINAASLSTSPSLTTVYNVTANASGCPLPITGSGTIFVNPLPIVTLNIKNTFCLQEATLNLSGTPIGGTFNGQAISGSIFSPVNVGSYSISYIYTDQNNCSNSDSKMLMVNTCSNLEAKTVSSSIKVYPNPVLDILTIETEDETKMDIYSFNGQIVFTTLLKHGLNDINLAAFNPGLYYIKYLNRRILFTKN